MYVYAVSRGSNCEITDEVTIDFRYRGRLGGWLAACRSQNWISARKRRNAPDAQRDPRLYRPLFRGGDFDRAWYDSLILRERPLTYNQRTCRTIRGSCHCPSLSVAVARYQHLPRKATQ